MPTRAFQRRLDDTDLEWLRVRFTTESGRVTAFMVQYETIIDGQAVAVARFDTAHGFPHLDILDRRGRVITKTRLVDQPTVGAALTYAARGVLQGSSMNDPNAIDHARAAQITKRIGETFDFMRDVLDDPSILDEIPDGAEIEVRQVAISGQIYRIVAYRSESGPERWIARTTGQMSAENVRGHDFSVAIRLSSTVSAEAAMDGVEAALRAAEETDQVAHRIA